MPSEHGDCIRCGSPKFRNASGKLFCKPCKARCDRERRQRDPVATRESKRAEYVRNQERYRDGRQRYYQANREVVDERAARWRRDHPEERRRHKQAWASKNHARAREYAARRRALKLAAICEHGESCVTPDVLEAARVGACTYCGGPAAEADHFIPLARGGSHCRDNLVPACVPCNRSKSDQMPDEWRRTRTA